MNQLRLAQQGFEGLSRSLNTVLNEATSDRIEAWLHDEVCLVAAELVQNRSFQAAARWSVDHLSPGVDTRERRLVEEVDRALVRCGAQLMAAVGLDHQPPDAPGETSCTETSLNDGGHSALPLIAGRRWFDLVCAGDYFHPSCGLLLRRCHDLHTNAFRRKELRVPLGDYVGRSMFARIEYWKSILDPLCHEVFSSLASGGDEAYRVADQLFNRKLELESAVNKLSAACNQEQDARQREACAALTLVYAAYAAQPHLEWLGYPSSWQQASALLIRSCIRRRGVIQFAEPEPLGTLRITAEQAASLCDPTTVRQIARALHAAAAFYDLPEDPDDMVECARHRFRLVLVDRSPRQVFWDGSPVAAGIWDRHAVEWNLLWTLAENLGRVVDQGMLQSPERHQIRSRRNRLAGLLTDGLVLDGFIVNLRRHGYRLDLESNDVVLLRDDGLGRLGIVGPRRCALV